jgi:hypothetical protein
MLRPIGLVTCLAFLMAACGGGGGAPPASGSVAVVAPSGLQYSGNPDGNVDVPHELLQPTVTGAVSRYSVSPALPAGLTLDPTSGVISGTPLVASSGTTHIVTASNAAGAATVAVTIVIFEPPTALTYPSPVTATLGATFAPLVPTFSGYADSFWVSPPMPAGLTFDSETGIVSGTPSRERVAVTYTVTARNRGGASTHADLVLAVGPPPAGTAVTGVFRSDTVIGLGYVSGTHSGLTDTRGAFTYEEGRGITFSVGAVSIGTVPTPRALVTPVDLNAQGTGPSNRVLNVVRFLMMLDQDLNVNNGIQISAAVTAAAASWAPVDFDTAELPAVLSPLIQQASAADGVSHVLPDAVTAQAHLRTAFYCTHSGYYEGRFSADSSPGQYRHFEAFVLPDGSMRATARGEAGVMTGFNVQTSGALSPLLDATFAQSAASPSVDLQGSIADATYLSGTYLADDAGGFEALADASVAATYKFTGYYTSTPISSFYPGPFSAPVIFGTDDEHFVSSLFVGATYRGLTLSSLAGTVSGNAFTGTASYWYPGNARPRTFYAPVSGTYLNTASGATFDGQFSTEHNVVTFSTVGCRGN